MPSPNPRRWLLALAVALIIAALAWLALRDSSTTSAPSSPTTATATPTTSSPPPPTLRRPPPRRPGLLDPPDASAHPDATAPTGALIGTVTSWLDSTPVPDAELTFLGAGTIHSTLTDATGHFSFAPPEPGPYRLASVLADGFQPYAPQLGQAPLRYQSRPGQRVEGVSIQLLPRVEITGEVVDADDRPIPRATIRILGIGTGEAAMADDDPELESDARGEFRFDARPGQVLEAAHDPAGVGRARVDERALAVGRLRLTLVPDAPRATGTIAGQVTDPAGEPVEGARVLAQAANDDDPEAEAVTDASGRFELVDLVPGPHRIEARHPPHAPVWASRVPTGSHAVRLVLAGGSAITGTITAASGDAIPGSTVVALRHTGPLTRIQQAQITVFDVDGEFRLEGLPPALYDIVGGAAGHASTRVRAIEVGTTEAELTLVLPEGGRIEGTVVDAHSGEPIELARVEVERALATGASIAPLRSSALSDDAGAFTIVGVEPGRHSIYAYALGYAPRALSGIEVEAGGRTGPVEVALTPAEDAAGEVFDIVGIGVMIRVDGETLFVAGTVEDGGAARAGVLERDRLLAIDGVPVAAFLDFQEAVQALRGHEGTEVRLTIEREEQAPFDLTVIRRRIRG